MKLEFPLVSDLTATINEIQLTNKINTSTAAGKNLSYFGE